MHAFQDLRYALRGWARDPGFAVAAVGVLGMGIALAVAGSAVASAYLVRPLPFPAAERVYSVRVVPEGADWRLVPEGFAALDWEGVEAVAEKVGTWDLDAFSLVGEGRPEQVRGAWVTPELLELTGARAALGRLLEPGDAAEGGAPVAVISHGLWQRRYGGSEAVLGRTIRTFSADRPEDAEVFEIVGVLAADFWHVNTFTEVLTPLEPGRTPYLLRLRPGVAPEAAAAWLTGYARERLPGADPAWRMGLEPLRESYVGPLRSTLLMVLGAVGLVLLVACGNVAVLLLVRATRRDRELGIRRALGAGRRRLASQLVAEGLVLSGAAAALGTGLAALALEAVAPTLETRLGVRVPGGAEALTLDAASLGVALAAAVLTALLFGLVPLLTAGGSRLHVTLRSSARSTETGGRRRARSVLMAGEVAVSLALLILAGLMGRSALNVHRLELGFEPREAMVASLQLRARSHPEDAARLQLFRSLRERVETLPGVEAAGLVSRAPLTYSFAPTTFEAASGFAVGGAAAGSAVLHAADDGYAGAAGLRLTAGRWFTDADDGRAAPVVVVSEGLARALWPQGGAVGEGIRVARTPAGPAEGEPEWRTVVGVVGDVRKTLTGSHYPDVYVPVAQAVPMSPDLVVRAGPEPLAAVPGIRAAVAELDPEIPVATPRTLASLVGEERAPTDFLAWMLGAFSALTLALAVVGLYGVIAYAVGQRRRDVAIRMALGAPASSVVAGFVREGLAIAAGGVAVGAAGAAVLGRVAASQLHGVSPTDPATYVVLAAALGAAALAATWIPARRAARTEPASVLREE